MQKAAKKFKKYAESIENDIQTMMFELLDIIHAKTITLRYLMKLHVQIKTITRLNFAGEFPNVEDLKTSLFSNNYNTALTELNEKVLSKKESCDEISEKDLSAIQEDIDRKLEEVSERLVTIENINSQIDQAESKNREKVVQEAKQFINEIVDQAVANIESRPKSMKKKRQIRPQKNEKGKTIIETSKEKDVNEKVTASKEKSTQPKDLNNLSSNILGSFTNLEKIITDLQTSVLTKKQFDTTYRTIMDPEKRRLIKENNKYSQHDASSFCLDSESKRNHRDVELCFMPNVPNIALDKISNKQYLNKIEDAFPEIITTKELQQNKAPPPSPNINSDDKEDTGLIKRSKSNKSNKSIKSTNINSDEKEDSDLIKRSKSNKSNKSIRASKSGRSIKSSKSGKSSDPSLSKLVLDNNTYRKICNAIQSSFSKQDFAQLGEIQIRKAVKCSSSHELNTQKLSSRSTDVDLYQYALHRARSKKPRGRRV